MYCMEKKENFNWAEKQCKFECSILFDLFYCVTSSAQILSIPYVQPGSKALHTSLSIHIALFLFFFAKKKSLPSFSSKSLRHKLFLLLLQHFFTKDFPSPILFKPIFSKSGCSMGSLGWMGVLKEFGISLCPRKSILPPMLKYKRIYVGLLKIVPN